MNNDIGIQKLSEKNNFCNIFSKLTRKYYYDNLEFRFIYDRC